MSLDQLCASVHERDGAVDGIAAKRDVDYFSLADNLDAELDGRVDRARVLERRLEGHDFHAGTGAP